MILRILKSSQIMFLDWIKQLFKLFKNFLVFKFNKFCYGFIKNYFIDL